MLYRKINCKDRLPEKERAEYSTDIGTLFFSEKEWWDEFQEFPEWWLEEVTLPTDEEIEKMAEQMATNANLHRSTMDYMYYLNGVRHGAKYIMRVSNQH